MAGIDGLRSRVKDMRLPESSMRSAWHLYYEPGEWAALVLLYVPLVIAVGVFAWALRQRSPSGRKRAYVWMRRVVLFCVAWPIFQSILNLFRAFTSLAREAIDPSQKARILAESISEVMNCTVWMLIVLAVTLPMLIVLRRRLPKEELAEEREPPQ